MRNVYNYLVQNCSTNPKKVDRLIISAFFKVNQIVTPQNLFLRSYIISKTDDKEFILLNEFIYHLQKEILRFDFEELIKLFEFVISPSDRIVNGAVYTPENIREYIIQHTLQNQENIANITIADIACGCGGFLYTAAKSLKETLDITYSEIFQNHIYGLDIQGYSAKRTEILLSLLALTEGEDEEVYHFNIYEGDALSFKWEDHIENFTGFTAIVGNPPYVRLRSLNPETKLLLKNWEVCKTGLTDLYIPFFQIGIENLAEGGVLGYITMNSFFKSLNGRALRDYFKNKTLGLRIIDFGADQIFKAKNTYVCICFIQNEIQDSLEYASIEGHDLNEEITYERLPYSILNSKTGWNLRNNNAITRIENNGDAFGSIYKTRHGIATLKNDIYIFRPADEDADFYYLQNGRRFQIEKDICKDIVNSNKLSRERDIETLKEKVIFPYNNDNGNVNVLNEEFIRDTYPMAYEYLQYKREILSTRDKGKGADYENWYAFGRTQSLDKMEHKLFFPKFSDVTPKYIIDADDSLLFYNGMAVIGDSAEELILAKKIMESSVFWYYIKTTSKPYSSKYYSLNGTYINNFGVCELNENEREYVIRETNQDLLNEFFEEKYGVLI